MSTSTRSTRGSTQGRNTTRSGAVGLDNVRDEFVGKGSKPPGAFVDESVVEATTGRGVLPFARDQLRAIGGRGHVAQPRMKLRISPGICTSMSAWRSRQLRVGGISHFFGTPPVRSCCRVHDAITFNKWSPTPPATNQPDDNDRPDQRPIPHRQRPTPPQPTLSNSSTQPNDNAPNRNSQTPENNDYRASPSKPDQCTN